MQSRNGTLGRAIRLLLTLTILLGMLGAWAVSETAAAGGDTVVAWGDNAWGQIGSTNETCGGGPCSRTPLPVLSGVVAIAGGMKHSLVLKADGTVWAWGNNDQGQLGDGTTTARAVPTKVKGLAGVIAIEAGDYHSLAITHEGIVWAWGWNGFGQIGDGTTTDRLVPVHAIAPPQVRAVAGGAAHTVALRNDGTVWAWGGNADGRLGDGTTTGRTTAVQVKGLDGIGVLSGITAIAVGGFHNLALRDDGTVWTWGWNAVDQLGHDEKDYFLPNDGGGSYRTTPWPVLDPSAPGPFAPLAGVTAITAGFLHSVALKGDGTVRAWGMNAAGQLGASSGNALIMKRPLTVTGPSGAGTLSGIVAVTAGGDRTFARRADGTLWSWGDNGGGALGDGTIVPQPSPVQVRAMGGQVPLSGVIAVAAAPRHTLAIIDPTVPAPPALPAPPLPGAMHALSLTSGPGGAASGGGTYPAGMIATLTAAPDPGQLFLGWMIDGTFAGWANPLTITMTGPHTATARFSPRQTFADATPDVTGATEAIAQLAARGVINGYGDGTYGPTDPISRAQMAALLVRAFGWGGENPPNPFTDRAGVDDELWRTIAILAARGVALGYGDGTYGTVDPVLNAQIVAFITRAMVEKGYWQYQPDAGTVYPGVPAHRQDLATFVHYAGAVRGTTDATGEFSGWDASSSRAWSAFTLWQALDSYWGIDRTP